MRPTLQHRGVTTVDYRARQRNDSATLIRWACIWASMAVWLIALAWVVT